MFSDSNAQQTARQSAQRLVTATTSDGELAQLARSTEVKVRAAVAAHPGIPLTTLLKLALDPADDVRIGVASNRRAAIPAELHEDLAKDKNVDVVFALIDNPAVSNALIVRLGRHLHREYARAARARAAAVKDGTWAPKEEALPEQAPTSMPEVPAFPVMPSPAPSAAVRRDALDILLEGTR